MRSAWWILGFSVVMAMTTGCPAEDDGGGGSGGSGDMCVDNGTASGLTPACASCGCTKCAAQVATCQDAACQSVLACGVSAGCTGTACYCGIGVAVADCLNIGASGPCMQQIVAASGVVIGSTGCSAVDKCAVALSPLTMQMGNPLYAANQVSACTKGTPAVMDAMGAITTPAVPGQCAAVTECGP